MPENEAATGEGQQSVTETPPNPLEVKLDGEGVPEQFKGKSINDMLKVVADFQAQKTRSEQEVAQWRQWAAEKMAAEASQRQGEPAKPAPNPLEAFDDDQRQALLALFGQGMKPVIDGLGMLQREVVKANRPDFDAVYDQAKQIYDGLPYHLKVDPNYGWDFSYRMAKANELKNTPPPPTPPQPGPSAGASAPPPSLTAEEKEIAKNFGISEADYIKYKVPVDPTQQGRK